VGKGDSAAEDQALLALFNGKGDPAAAIANLQGREQTASIRKAQELVSEWTESGRFRPPSEGSVLTVDLPTVTVEDFLDWDKPLAQQSRKVQAVMKSVFEGAPLDRGMDGRTLYNELANRLGSDQAASAALREQGIAGNRYLDAISRQAGAGSHNYVLFSDEGINITGRRRP